MKTTKKLILAVTCIFVLACLMCVAWDQRGATLYYRYTIGNGEVFEPTKFTDPGSIQLKEKEGYRFVVRKNFDDEAYTAWYYEVSEKDKDLYLSHHTTYAIELDDDGELIELRSLSEMPTEEHNEIQDPDPKPVPKPDQKPDVPENIDPDIPIESADNRRPRVEIPDGPTISTP